MWLNMIFAWENHSSALPWIEYIRLPQAYVPGMSYLYHFFPFVQHGGTMGFAMTDAFSDVIVCTHL